MARSGINPVPLGYWLVAALLVAFAAVLAAASPLWPVGMGVSAMPAVVRVATLGLPGHRAKDLGYFAGADHQIAGAAEAPSTTRRHLDP